MAALNNNYLFTWKIVNFSLCAQKNMEILQSPTFKAESIGGSKWHLQLYPKGNTKGKTNFVALFLSRSQNEEEEIIDFEVEMIGDDGEVFRKLKTKHNQYDNTGFGWNEFIAKDILDKEMKSWKRDIFTVRCLLKNNSKSISHPACRSEVLTKIGVDRCCFQWNVKFLDYSSLKCSKDVFIGENTQFEFTLTALSDEIDINIRRLDEDTSESKVIACKISLLNLKGVEIESKKEIYTFDGDIEEDVWKFPSFLSKNFLLEKAIDLMKNNTLILKCQVSASTGETLTEFMNVKYDVPASLSLDDSVSVLLDDLRNTFETKNNSDIKLRIDDSIIPAHKYILCARSPVFRAMFDQNMRENQTGVVDIEDTDSETLISFLEFLYTGCVTKLTSESAKKLIVAADKYQVSSLTEKCSLFLRSELSVKNVCDVYAIGDMIDDELLKSSAYEFVAENSSIVFSSDVWSDWMKANVGLANKIFFKWALNSTT